MSFLLKSLTNKRDVDEKIRTVEDKVLVLRFGTESDTECLKLDHILAKSCPLLANMAEICIVDTTASPVYVKYFDITITPAIVFFFNAQHIKVGTADHSKFIGSFAEKQDFIDLIEVIYRGALKGKLIVNSPIDPTKLKKYSLLYKDI